MHQYFLENRKDLLHLIKRKAHTKGNNDHSLDMKTFKGGSIKKFNGAAMSSGYGAVSTSSLARRIEGNYVSQDANGGTDIPLTQPVNQQKNRSGATSTASESHAIASSVPEKESTSDTARTKNVKGDIEKRIRAVERQQGRFNELESKQLQLQNDNAVLSQLLNESRKKQAHLQEKMDKVIMMLYSVFSNTPLSRVLSGDSWVR